MQMRPGRTPGRTHVSDQLAAGDARSWRHRKARQMAVAGLDALAMIEFDQIAISICPACTPDYAVGRGVDRRADRAGNVDTGMHCGTAPEGIAAHAKAAGEGDRIDGTLRRDGDDALLKLLKTLPRLEQRAKLRIALRTRAGRRGCGRDRLIGATHRACDLVEAAGVDAHAAERSSRCLVSGVVGGGDLGRKGVLMTFCRRKRGNDSVQLRRGRVGRNWQRSRHYTLSGHQRVEHRLTHFEALCMIGGLLADRRHFGFHRRHLIVHARDGGIARHRRIDRTGDGGRAHADLHRCEHRQCGRHRADGGAGNLNARRNVDAAHLRAVMDKQVT